ncbi:MAG: hypothetical protein ACRC6V_02080 [Bacteroidales bacterium]
MKDLKICKFCNKEYDGRGASFCSKDCYAKFRAGKPSGMAGRKQSEDTIRKRVENTDQKKKEERRKQTMLD